MRQSVYLIIAFLLTISLSSKAQYPKLYFEHISTEDGLSNNRVYSILQDRKGFMWFATLDGLSCYDGYSFTVFRNNAEDSNSIHNNRIILLYEDSKGNIWMGTEKNGVEMYDPVYNRFTQYAPSISDNVGIPPTDVTGFCEKPGGNLYVRFADRICRFDRRGNRFIKDSTNFPVKNTYERNFYIRRIEEQFGKKIEIISFLKEPDATVWIGTRMDGLFIAKNNVIQHYTFSPFDALMEIKAIYRDRSGIIWIGSRNNGLFKHNPASRQFTYYNYFQNANEVIHDITVRAITEDFEGNIWIGTYNDGIIRFDRKNNTFTHFKNKNNALLPSDNMIRSLFTDSEGNIWIGSYAGICIFNVKTKSFSTLKITQIKERRNQPYQSNELYFNRVYGFSADHFGNIWIANWDALSCYNRRTKTFKHYPASFFGVEHIREVYVDKNNIVWISCEIGGMIQFNFMNDSYERYYPGKSNNNLVYKNVFDIYEDHLGNMWIATFNGLDRFEKNKGVFHHFFTNNGLSGNMIYGILDDSRGNLWFTTTNGISKYNQQKNEFISYNSKSGLMPGEFTEGGFYKSRLTGEFIVGGINGFNIFHPDSIKANLVAPEIVLTGLKIMNQPVFPQMKINGRIKLRQSISYSHQIELYPEDNIVTFEFAALHYAIPEKNSYRYKLEGFDKDWVTTDPLRRSATYTNLRSGNYIFKVQCANSDNVWSSKELTFDVKVLPPYWLTWWAFCIYGGFLILLFAIYRYFTLKSLEIKNSLLLERVKREKSEELTQMKINFFTNVSHEFRSPLTLILAPLEKILNAPSESRLNEYRKQFATINKNAKKLLLLTNQVMDLRKLEAGKMSLKATVVKIDEYIENIVVQFEEVAKQKNIILTFHRPLSLIEAWIDTEKFDKIISNLLSNALKFTPENIGKIDVWLNEGERNVLGQHSFSIGHIDNKKFFEISVEDNGIGIPSEMIYNIFNQFYRVENSYTLSQQGSGIGLAILKELVLLHKGQVLVKSVEGKGSLFTIRIPLGRDYLMPEQIDDIIFDHNNSVVWHPNGLLSDTNENKEHKEEPKKYHPHLKTLLIVEDNEDLRNFIEGTFIDSYNILTAENGRTGTSVAINRMPDLIISDIAMPLMSGIDLCKRLKNDVRTSHIPILLLTSRTSDDNKLEGYTAHADDYVEKPFNTSVLKARINSLLENRENVKRATSEGLYGKVTDSQPLLSPLDEDFMKTVNDYITQNVADVSLNVENLSRNMNISRSTLHLKLKAVTGQSATEYIMMCRMNIAVDLLREKRHNIVEISYKTGFNSPSYFIKCFRKKFGVTPKEFMEQ
jgi:signal transduction histidine kinase/ligand-binding sensor domain-containing protein/DNA-binding response OmpR family regulator